MRNTGLLAAPAEPVIENDLPLDLSCNSRRRSQTDDEENEECPRRHLDDDVVDSDGRGPVTIGGPPSPPRSPADFRALSELSYVAYHRQLMAMERQQRQWMLQRQSIQPDEQQEEGQDDERRRRRHHHQRYRRRDDVDEDDEDLLDDDDDLLIMRRRSGSQSAQDDSAEDDSDDSSHQPMDLGANPKAYKKSLMKRYRKSSIEHDPSIPSAVPLFHRFFMI